MNRFIATACIVLLALVGCGRDAAPPVSPATHHAAPAPQVDPELTVPTPVVETPTRDPELAAIEAEVLAEQERDARRGFTIRIGAMIGEEDGVSDSFSPMASRFRVTWTVKKAPETPITIHLLTDSGRSGYVERGEIGRIEGATNGSFVWKNAPRTHKLEVRGAKQWYMLQVDE